MEALQALIRKKDALEAEAESLTEQLSASNMGGISGPLVDREGFPRADVDVHATRLLRNRLACLNTDHRELMGQIEQSMHARLERLEGLENLVNVKDEIVSELVEALVSRADSLCDTASSRHRN